MTTIKINQIQPRKIMVEFSSKIFGGFRTTVSVTIDSTIDEIIALSVSDLFGVLETHNFRELLFTARQTTFHIHITTIEEILNTGNVWVCDHN